MDTKRIKYCELACGPAEKRDFKQCAKCEYGIPPALIPENQDAWRIWNEIQTQWRAGAAGVIGLDYKTIKTACIETGIKYTRALKLKIMACEGQVLKCLSRQSA